MWWKKIQMAYYCPRLIVHGSWPSEIPKSLVMIFLWKCNILLFSSLQYTVSIFIITNSIRKQRYQRIVQGESKIPKEIYLGTSNLFDISMVFEIFLFVCLISNFICTWKINLVSMNCHLVFFFIVFTLSYRAIEKDPTIKRQFLKQMNCR